MGFFENSIKSGAKLSDCLKYRYELWRLWSPAKPMLVIVMLNRSALS